jgi:glyoxylase-like metal-dependent hydrolase (beta-lactamase superfamily II)
MVLWGGTWKNKIFPSLCTAISHPAIGSILYDTGYSQRFFTETKNFPLRIYALTTPVYFCEEDAIVVQLEKIGIVKTDIKYIIISHFHGDHIGGLLDFPQARFICWRSAWEAVKNRRNWQALRAGFLPGLIPLDFEERAIFIEDLNQVNLPLAYEPFRHGWDLFGDGSLLAVELPGHAIGQLGLFVNDEGDRSYFLIADACWLSRAYQELINPHPIANLIFADRSQYRDTLEKIHRLHQLNPSVKIVPTHCLETWQEIQNI